MFTRYLSINCITTGTNFYPIRRGDTLNLADEEDISLLSHLCPGIPSPHRFHFQELATEQPYGRWQKGKAASTNTTIMTVSHIVQGLAVDLRGGRCQKTSCQVWNCESAQRRGGVFADRPLVHPETPTPSLWCLCVFVNEEILVPWWDIALSWADSASSVPSAPSWPHSHPTHPQSHQASGFTSLPVNETTGTGPI